MTYQRVATKVRGVDICTKCDGMLVRNVTGYGDDERSCMQCGRVTYIKSSKTKMRSATKMSAVIKHGEKSRKREKVRELVMEYGVNITADMVNMPRSTVGLWTKGLSNKPTWAFNRGKYSKEFKTEVAEYAIRAKNYYYTAKKYGIARSNIQNWVKEYKLHRGEGWLSK